MCLRYWFGYSSPSTCRTWEGAPAFTNSFVLRNFNTAFFGRLLETDGAYSAKTDAKQWSIGYDFGEIGKYGWQITSTWTAYDKASTPKETQAHDIVLHFAPQHYTSLNFDLRYTRVLNVDGISLDKRVGQILAQYHF